MRIRSLLFVLTIISILFFAGNTLAVTETAVHDVCEFDFPQTATLVTLDGGDIALDVAEVYGWDGLIRPNAKGSYVGEITILDGAGHVTHIDLYSYGGVARPWSLSCDNGTHIRIQSSYLDCRLAGVC